MISVAGRPHLKNRVAWEVKPSEATQAAAPTARQASAAAGGSSAPRVARTAIPMPNRNSSSIVEV